MANTLAPHNAETIGFDGDLPDEPRCPEEQWLDPVIKEQ
jgi:hypothetical protein